MTSRWLTLSNVLTPVLIRSMTMAKKLIFSSQLLLYKIPTLDYQIYNRQCKCCLGPSWAFWIILAEKWHQRKCSTVSPGSSCVVGDEQLDRPNGQANLEYFHPSAIKTFLYLINTAAYHLSFCSCLFPWLHKAQY